ncbi:hypothetical protein HHI36_014870 [Cryptolaemus montrouzieri]|uniref:Uncharacterized protein n=1 Tax=Cryptolaemus montrouzieri TaxID=559131 RepID=A0ABD2N3X6_9CUCU
MNENNTSENIPDQPAFNPPVNFEVFLILVKVLIAVMFIFPLAHYSMYRENSDEKLMEHMEKSAETDNLYNGSESTISDEIKKIKTRIILPPSCPASYILIILQELCADYSFRAINCIPEDFENLKKHQIPVSSARKNSAGDPRNNIVSFLTAVLLVVSLIAAFLELYKAKKQTPAKTKAPLTRKCSLADLTVLKHHRKEMVRRDSILECQEQDKQPANFKKAPPLQRSSSTPAEHINELSAYNVFNRSLDSRRNSVVDNQQFTNYSTIEYTNRSNVEARRCSILDSRKVSIVDGKFVDRYDSSGRRISIDITSSPERKHHSRLVHRH